MAGGYDDNAVVYDTCSICKHLQVQCSTSILDIIPISVLCLHIYIYVCVCVCTLLQIEPWISVKVPLLVTDPISFSSLLFLALVLADS